MAVLISMFKVSKTCYQGIMQEIISFAISWSPGLHLLTRKKKYTDVLPYTQVTQAVEGQKESLRLEVNLWV